MNLHPSQILIARDTHRFRVANCGRRFGKSMLASEEIKGKAVAKPSIIVYIAPTYQQSRDIMWEILLKELRPIIIDKNESRLEITCKTLQGGESKIILRGWESIETLRGISVDFVVIDEISSMRNFFMYWNEVIRPCLSDRKGSGLFISTPKGFNHFYDLYNKENTDSDYKSFNFSTYDNPFIPSEEIDKAKEELPEDTFAQEYLAQFRKREGLVYPEFNRKKHMYKELPKIDLLDTISGIDWGYKNPTAITKIYVDREYNYYIDEEFYERGKTTDYSVEVAKNMKCSKYYPDPENPEACDQAREWLNVRPVNKSVVHGIDCLRELFKQNKILVNARCVNLINEIEQYAYPDSKDGKNDDEKPIKDNDHCFTWDTKVTMYDGKQKNIKDIKIGDYVKSKNGINKVLLTWELEPQKIVETTLSNGYKIKSTIDHKFYTSKGIKPLNEISYDDIIIVLNHNKIKEWKKQLNLMVKDITGMVNTIAQLVGANQEEKDFIKLFGNFIMGRYHKDSKYIIKTKIEQIMTSLTLNLKAQKNIYQNILKKIGRTKNLEKELENISKALIILQKIGTNQKKEENGIQNMLRSCTLLEKNIKRFVKYAKKNMRRTSLTELDFAATIVKQKVLGEETVYNITVQSDHNFYANNILVKNCMDSMRYAIYNYNPENNETSVFKGSHQFDVYDDKQTNSDPFNIYD